MRLFHYSAEPVKKVRSVPMKSRGARHGKDAIGDKPFATWALRLARDMLEARPQHSAVELWQSTRRLYPAIQATC